MIKTIRVEDLLRIDQGVRPWEFIVIHHTVTDMDVARLYGWQIDDYHRTERKYTNGMGYQMLINPNGVLEIGDRWMYQLEGAHTKGFNQRGIGVALVGNFSNGYTHPTREQLETLWKIEKLFSALRVYPHCAFTATECPGRIFDLENWYGVIDKAPTKLPIAELPPIL